MITQPMASAPEGPPVRFVGDGTVSRDPAAEELLAAVRHLPGMKRITALPDFAVNGPEKADSWVVELQGWVVPALATNIVNCGMGLIDTGLMAGDVSEQDMKTLLGKVWETSRSEDYTLPQDQVDDLFLDGVGALTRQGWLREDDAGAFEFGGSALPDGQSAGLDLDEIVPRLLRRLPRTRRPARLNLGGNHFVELQVVDGVVDPDRLEALGLKEGQLVMMIHTDHQLTGNINLHYVLRNMYFYKPPWTRAAYFLSRAWFHFGDPARWRRAAQRWRLYFGQRDFARLPADSPEGRRYLAAYNLATNYGYAARAVIYRMCLDILQWKFGHQHRPHPRLVCDTNHESIRVREGADGPVVVTRKGAVECLPNSPALIAGSYDVPSLLGECAGSDETALSYDHGSANFRERLGEPDGRLEPAGATMTRYIGSSATRELVESREQRLPVRSRLPMEAMASLLNAREAVRPVAWLRPVANLSQR